MLDAFHAWYISTHSFVGYADPSDPHRTTEETRKLGLIVCRGTTVMLIAPEDGYE